MILRIKVSIILIFLPLILMAQIYYPIDSTYLFKYKELKKVQDKIENYNLYNNNLRLEIKLLDSLDKEKTEKILKLEIRDSLYRTQVMLYRESDLILREKITKNLEIINNYRLLLSNTEEQIRLEQNARKKETLWKNIYKYGYPVAGLIVAILILKK